MAQCNIRGRNVHGTCDVRGSELGRSAYIEEQRALLVDKPTSVHHDDRPAPKEVADDRKKEEGDDTATHRRHIDLTSLKAKQRSCRRSTTAVMDDCIIEGSSTP
jgi:hypothetical protein